MRTIEQLLAEAPAFEGMERDQLELIAGCAGNVVIPEQGYVMREGDPADAFYVIRSGRLAMETFIPQRGGGLTIETIDDGELLGWSWLVPPYRVHLDVRALVETHAIRFDAACLRGKCEHDSALGYELMKRFVPVIVERLRATRLRLLDVYGPSDGG
jgi:CRP/FNR family transcriptional regulator, cyclic AMP receptor protein